MNNDFLDEITEIRTCCGFRENMIHVANKPFDVSRLELACLLISLMFHPRYHSYSTNTLSSAEKFCVSKDKRCDSLGLVLNNGL